MITLDRLIALDDGQRQRDTIAHESAHAVAAVLLRIPFDGVRVEKYPDAGTWGSLYGEFRPRTENVRLRLAVVARIGVMLTVCDRWDDAGAALDRKILAAMSPSGMDPVTFDWFVVTPRAERLVSVQAFRDAHTRVYIELENEGELTGEQVEQIVAEVTR
jgi:hypothetical protein